MMHISPLPVGAITPEGWIASQARANLDGFLGEMPQISTEVGSHVFSSGRLGSDSEAQNREAVQWWNGESEGNWLWGWSAHVRLAGTDSEKQQVSTRFDEIAAAAGADGYIGMFDASYRAIGAIPGDCWTQSRILGALADWATYRGENRHMTALARAISEVQNRLPAQVEQVFGPPKQETFVRGHDLQLAEFLMKRARANPDLGAIAIAMYDAFDRADLSWMEYDCQLGHLVGEDDFVGHGAHVVENLRIPLLLSELIAEDDAAHSRRLSNAAHAGWAKILRALAMSGAIRSDESVAAEGEPVRPFPEAGQEYCAMTELAITCIEFARISGTTEALDVAERIWLNAAQAGRASDGGGTAYFIADNQTEASKSQGARWDISPTHDDAAVCCSPNAGRILPTIVDSMVVASTEGAAIWFYGPSIAKVHWNGQLVTIRQITNYPFSDNLRIEVTGAPPGFQLHLRKPGWLDQLNVDVDSALATETDPRGATVTGGWPSKAILTVDLRPTITEERTIDGRIALLRGPLLFAVDLPSRWAKTHSYPGTDLADRDAILANDAPIFPPYLLASTVNGAKLERTEVLDDPWSNPPMRLKVAGVRASPTHQTQGVGTTDEIELIPFGSTTLRYACLPYLPR